MAVNRLGAAGLLVCAIHELPEPKEDILEQAEQLCQFIRTRQKADGSLHYTDNPADDPTKVDPEGVATHPGVALYALMLSQRHRPAAWKTDAVRKALPYYRTAWKAAPNPAFAGWYSAAFTEAYLRTKEKAFADFVFEMNDLACGLQYELDDLRNPNWLGGFRAVAGGKAVPDSVPTVETAVYAMGLAEACRVTRQAADLDRNKHYSASLKHALQFLTRLQYTDGNTQHFTPTYRGWVVGGFHASAGDGNLRTEHTAQSVSALVQFLAYVAERP
jgi:hypothetical protein